ncbi:MAG: UDP-N-acetylglucosamine--N-acetylmuramyl-(pentapeptide) pyrophosphoryl-undecaprenol N-acetylglucosamine transferase [Dehalococcoidia bacterium]|nr:UDP-N-acetylglucosamine--N-acetylmuramyl-(pentapeptide) pyrophosphoryl-undecaprenol N-acetylglucosamine transferase [Dehalococcoidia bacterium]
MKYALAGGGTGGHAYPSITVGEELRRRGHELVYYGTERGPEHGLADSAGIPFRGMAASQVRGGPRRMARGGLNLVRGTRHVAAHMRADRPAALFATGGYAAAPVGLAARRHRVPMLVFLPDVHPGWAVRFLNRFATGVACSVDAALPSLPRRKSVVTGYPVRAQFLSATREEGRRRFGLDSALPTVLVTGGSLGARAINQAVAQSLPRLLARAQVLHVCGRHEEAALRAERERLPAQLCDRYHLLAYTDEMAWAMAASDLAVARAGASTLGELPMAGLPAVVIPGGFSDQQLNARYLEARGAAVTLGNDQLDRLEGIVLGLLEDEGKRARMAAAMRGLAHPEAASQLADLLEAMAA